MQIILNLRRFAKQEKKFGFLHYGLSWCTTENH